MDSGALLANIDQVIGFRRQIDYGTWNDANRQEWRTLCETLLDQLTGSPKFEQFLEAKLTQFDGLTNDSDRIRAADEIIQTLRAWKRTLKRSK
jgi:hypothetical protein